MTTPRVEVPFLQYLDEKGAPIAPLPDWTANPDILLHYYRQMVLARVVDQKAVALQRTGQMGTYPSCMGQEAISTVFGYLLQHDDVLVPYYRDAPGQLQRGMEIEDIFLYWGGDERGSARPSQRKDFPICVPIATQAGHAAGIATAMRVRNQRNAVLCSCGDGATSKGDFLEALNLAGVWQLPLVFIINNNQWAISVPRKLQCGAPTLVQKGIAAGLPSVQVDGNDVIALHEAIDQALQHARRGKGATVIEAITYRLSDHTTADDATRYRPSEELKQAWLKEPIKRLQTWLHQNGHWNESKEQQLQEEASAKVQQAVESYLKTPHQPISELFDYHYAEIPPNLEIQKEEALSRVAEQVTRQESSI
ncbi:pyruvate dehydrogenase (acetyl-transferring) E1 component subunit alpha [Endozoicomonadaceae bacterium StTr2]